MLDECKIRWRVRSDDPKVREIEHLTGNRINQVLYKEYVKNNRAVTILVAEMNGDALGWMAYENVNDVLNVLHIATHLEWQRCGVASKMFEYMLSKFNDNQFRKAIEANVDQGNLPAHKLLAKFKFKAEIGEECYTFKYVKNLAGSL